MTELLLMTMEDLCAALQLGKSTIYRMISEGRFPPPVKVGGANRWPRSHVLEWVDGLPRSAMPHDEAAAPSLPEGTEPPSDALLTPKEAARRIGVCTKTLRQIRNNGAIRYVAVTARKIFYRPEDCDAFLKQRVTAAEPRYPTQRRSIKRAQPAAPSFMAGRQDRTK